MQFERAVKWSLALCCSLAGGQAAASQPPSAEEMWQIIQEQQKQIGELKAQLGQTDQKVEATGEAIDAMQQGGGSSLAAQASLPPADHRDNFLHGTTGKTSVGGYGEMHYNNLSGTGGASDKQEIDFHRAIVYLSHQFNDDIRFFSEIEYEHANTEANGVVELEQAYLEFDLSDRLIARTGLFLIPVGILNETHEPATFYGVERNPVEGAIIPSTWWAGGGSLSGQLGMGFSFDLAVHEGLNTAADDSYRIRAGRQFTSEAVASDLAYTGRLKWTGVPGVEVAGTIQHQSDLTQGSDPTAGSANLFEVHTALNKGPFGLRALYALWDLEGNGPAALGADEQSGWYVEPSYKPIPQLGVFTRYNVWDNAAGDTVDSANKQWDVGVNYWPHPYVVLKADYMQQDNDNGKNREGFNLGIGYQF